MVRKGIQLRRRSNFKGWRPALDQHGHPTVYQHCIRPIVDFEFCLFGRLSGKDFGYSCFQAWLFGTSSALVRSISAAEMLAVTAEENTESTNAKGMSLQIRTCHRKELRQWKSEQLSRFFGDS